MSDKKGKRKTGPPPFEEIYRESFTSFRFVLPESHLEFIRQKSIENRISMAEYMRRLIAADMGRD